MPEETKLPLHEVPTSRLMLVAGEAGDVTSSGEKTTEPLTGDALSTAVPSPSRYRYEVRGVIGNHKYGSGRNQTPAAVMAVVQGIRDTGQWLKISADRVWVWVTPEYEGPALRVVGSKPKRIA